MPKGPSARAGESKQDSWQGPRSACRPGLLFAGFCCCFAPQLWLPGGCACVPTGDAPGLGAAERGSCPPPGVALCVAGLAQRAAQPWRPARCRALFQRQLPVGTAWQLSLLRARRGRTLLPWAAGSPPGRAATRGATAVVSLQFSAQPRLFLPGFCASSIPKAEQGMSKEPVLPHGAENSLWRGAQWRHPLQKAPGFPPWSCVREGGGSAPASWAHGSPRGGDIPRSVLGSVHPSPPSPLAS